MRRDVVTVALAAALAMAMVGCQDSKGSDGKAGGDTSGATDARRTDPAGVLRKAVEKTGAQASYKTVQTGENGTSRSDMLYQRTPAASSMTSATKKSADTPDGLIRFLSVGGTMYVASAQVPGKSWYSMSGGEGGEGGGAARAAGYIDEFGGALAATENTRWVAEETVGGRKADHYRGTVDFAALSAYKGTAFTKEARERYTLLAKRNHRKSAVIDMWVGKDGLVLKSHETTTDSKGKKDVLNEEYSDFGAVPKITAPPADQVLTFEQWIDTQTRG
ncbi:hypothetical protein ABT160_37305 [Streptomyces sp. NPDC001941]|uniref:hypothetical protein n=1 Tax=Streptomyces sp. NPDC001941 TaxID=3154659 RepID=UPI0033287B8A